MPLIKRVLKITGLILATGFAIHYVFDPLAPITNQIERNKLLHRLTLAKANWDSQNITDYSYDVEYWIPLWGQCGAKITVRQGMIVEVIENKHGGIDTFMQPIILDQKTWDHAPCHYSQFTIPEIFDTVQKLANTKIKINVIFDPEFGFITWYYGHKNVNRGIFSTYVTESEFSYRFSNLRRLDSSLPSYNYHKMLNTQENIVIAMSPCLTSP